MTLALVSTCVGGRRAGTFQPMSQPPSRPKPEPRQTGLPLNLTARQCRVLDAYARLGLGKIVAPELGMTLVAFNKALEVCRQRAGHATSIQLIAAYVAAKYESKQ